MPPQLAKPSDLASALRMARERAGLSQEEAGVAIGVSRQTIGTWEHETKAAVPRPKQLTRAAEVYGVSVSELRGAMSPPEPYTPRPSTRRLPPPVFAVVHGYLEQMERAGCSEEMLDEAERLMVDWNFSKLHKRDPRDRTTDEMIVDVRAIWSAIEETLRDDGVKL